VVMRFIYRFSRNEQAIFLPYKVRSMRVIVGHEQCCDKRKVTETKLCSAVSRDRCSIPSLVRRLNPWARGKEQERMITDGVFVRAPAPCPNSGNSTSGCTSVVDLA
jgi:hypothetical protein